MILLQQIKTKPNQDFDCLIAVVSSMLRVREQQIINLKILRKAIDARKKPSVYFIYSLAVSLEPALEKSIVTRSHGKITYYIEKKYVFPSQYENFVSLDRPVVVGSGPAGLFSAYYFARCGLRPILLERGENIEERSASVNRFWSGNQLNPHSNVQFGEGGAGTFSDGKLNTMIKDKEGRIEAVLTIFNKFGAPDNILYDSKPHIGTDILKGVVINMREEIIQLGGEVHFNSLVEDIVLDKDSIKAVVVRNLKSHATETYSCNYLVLALGHSARDTIKMLYTKNISMEQKSFAVGMRVEHPQELINQSQYGADYQSLYRDSLPAAPYKLTAQTLNGRGVYSFCMCPGGYVVNASSVNGCLCVNGMSYSKRDGKHANSAIVITVNEKDFKDNNPLTAMEFQENLEQKAFLLANGKIPVQFYGDFVQNSTNREDKLGNAFTSLSIKGEYSYANLRTLFSKELYEAFLDGMQQFDRKIHGFADDSTLLIGLESRTSSPVRILRDEFFESNLKGVYPCGEGAGYAGGIVSAAVDGLKVAESITKQILPHTISNN